MANFDIQDNLEFQAERNRMVRMQIEARGVKDPMVLSAIRRVPRHKFVPKNLRSMAYEDSPLGIGYGQTISQPFIVAFMTELLNLKSSHNILEIGTGSGYQTAVLAEIVKIVYSVEIIPELKDRAEAIFNSLGYTNIALKVGDGYFGWPDAGPFNGILVAAAPAKVPEPLLEQLSEGGSLILPVGYAFQNLEVYSKIKGKIHKERNIPVRFVPMTGHAETDN